METLPGVAPPEQQNTYFYIGQHETRRTVPVTTELGNQAQDAGVSFLASLFSGRFGHCCVWHYETALAFSARSWIFEYGII
jgi:hypothetical protein